MDVWSGAGRLASWVSPWQVQGSPDKADAETLIIIVTFQHVAISSTSVRWLIDWLLPEEGRKSKWHVLLLPILSAVVSHGVQFQGDRVPGDPRWHLQEWGSWGSCDLRWVGSWGPRTTAFHCPDCVLQDETLAEKAEGVYGLIRHHFLLHKNKGSLSPRRPEGGRPQQLAEASSSPGYGCGDRDTVAFGIMEWNSVGSPSRPRQRWRADQTLFSKQFFFLLSTVVEARLSGMRREPWGEKKPVYYLQKSILWQDNNLAGLFFWHHAEKI